MMFTFSKFLCCFRIEFAGFVIGWLGIISSIISVLALIFALIFAFHDVVNVINSRFSVHQGSALPIVGKSINSQIWNLTRCLTIIYVLIVIIVAFAVVFGLMLMHLYTSVLLIRGTENVSDKKKYFFIISLSQ